MVKEGMYLCSKCHNDVPISMIRYLPEGKGMICTPCQNANAPKGLSIENRKEASQIVSESGTAKIKERPKKIGVRMMCNDCDYNWVYNPKSLGVLRCPYCSKQNIIPRQSAAESILQEVSRNSGLYS